MTRFSAIRFNPFPPRGAAITAICLALAITVGCPRGESSKSKGPASDPAAKPDKGDNKSKKESPDAAANSTTGHEVLSRMVAAYHKATSYSDFGTVHFLAEADGKKIQEETVNFSLAFVRPNKLHIRAYKAELVCDGRTLYAYVNDVPGQIFNRPAPERLTMTNVQPDLIVRAAMTEGVASGMPQIPLLFSKDPLKMLLHDLGEPELSEPGQIDGRDYYRLKFKLPVGVATFWIDQQNYALRRIVLPTDSLRETMSQEGPISNLSVVADFAGAQLDGEVDPKAFEFEVPKDAKLVEYLVPPHMGQLLNKNVPDFKFTDLAGKPVTPEALAGKTAVLMFWSAGHGSYRQVLKNLDEVCQKYKDNPKVAFYAVCRDPSQLSNADMEKAIADLNVHVPILRDVEASGVVFNLGVPPTTFIINDRGIVQHCEGGLNPKYAESLQAKLDKTLAGEEIFQEPLKQYLEQVDELRQFAKSTETEPPEPKPGDAVVVREERLPEVKVAQRSAPTTLTLAPLWKCTDLKLPGNIAVVSGKRGPERLLVIENATSVAEVGLDGKLIALHKLKLAEKEAVGALRTAVGADGRRYVVAFLVSEQRCHLFDENWNLVVNYPEDALQNPHSGIADVRLDDLDGDGKLKMYVGYWGVVGVQAASLDGNRIWGNRADVSTVACMAIGDADAKGRRDLFCTGNSGAIVVLDAQGQRRGEVRIGHRILYRIANADLRGDGTPVWCGLAALKMGEATAVGFSLTGEELWNYPLPVGIQSQPIEPIVSGNVTRNGPGQWLLPGPDGSIHIISADGKLLDKFNYGAVLHGLATFETGGQPVLVVASPDGLEAWKVQ